MKLNMVELTIHVLLWCMETRTYDLCGSGYWGTYRMVQ